ncbi:MAG: WD40 repeat domain-containing protein [Magnetococcus sp. THC-1_WYH]
MADLADVVTHPHMVQVMSIAFSPDGKTIVSGSWDKTIRLWERASGKSIAILERHSGPVLSVAFSPDGKTIASGSGDKTIRLWERASGKLIATLEGHSNWVNSVAFSPDGKTIASGSEDKTIRLWNRASGKSIATLEGHSNTVNSVTFSPDGNAIASGSDDKTIRLWERASGKSIATLEGHSNTVNSVAFSPDGKTIASGSDDKTIRLWKLASGKSIATLEGHNSLVFCVAFSPDGKTIASGSGDRTIRLWEGTSGKLIVTLGGDNNVNSVAFSPDGNTIASGSDDKTIRLWNRASGKLIATLEGHDYNVSSVAFSPDGNTIASGSGDTIRLWERASGKLTATLVVRGGGVLSVAFSPDGKTIASGSMDNTIRLWERASGKLISTLEGHGSYVNSVAFSPDGKTIASGSGDKTIRLWERASGRLITTLNGYSQAVFSVAFSPDGNTIASGSDRTIRLWEHASGKLIAALEAHRSFITSVAFSPDGQTIASGSGDGTIRLWDRRTRKTIAEQQLPSSVWSLNFSHDGRLVSSEENGMVQVWQTSPTLEKEMILLANKGHWFSCRQETKTCLSYDDGTLLMQKDSQGFLHPLIPEDAGENTQLELATFSDSIVTCEGGEATPVTVRLRNLGKLPVYWLRLFHEEPSAKDISLVFIPATPHLRLDPGQAAKLTGHVFAVSSREFPKDQQSHTLKLAITSARGEPLRLSREILARTPQMELWEKPVFDHDKRIVVIGLKNTGGASVINPTYAARLEKPEITLGEVSPGDVPPGAVARVSFTIPDDRELTDESRLFLTIRQTQLPLHIWQYPGQPIQLGLPLWLRVTLYSVGILALALFTWYYRMITHPLVTGPSRNPEALRMVALESLATAHKLLQKTRRLESILTAINLPRQRLDRARDFANLPPGERLQWLAALLTAKTEAHLDPQQVFGVIELGETFPLNLPRLLLYSPQPTTPTEEAARTFLQLPECRQMACFMIIVDPQQRRTLQEQLKDHSAMWVIPESQEITSLLLAAHPEERFAQVLASHIKVGRISPYQTREGVNKVSGFFGRRQILTDILTTTPRNHLLVGGRQLGKSSILKALKRSYDQMPGTRCHYLSASHRDIAPMLAPVLGLPITATMETVLQTMADLPTTGETRIFLLDEVDRFVAEDAQHNYPIMQQFRNLSAEHRCHFIMAGFWGLYRRTMDYHSPLKNFGDTHQIGALDEDACWEMATKPMTYLGVHYENDDLVKKIITQTGQRANLIAITCNTILTDLDMTTRTIHAEHVDRALDSTDLRNALGGWEKMNDDGEKKDPKANSLDRILVYLAADGTEITLPEIQRELLALDMRVAPEAIKESLIRLELAFVLHREENRYRHQIPLLKNIVVAESPRDLIAGERAAHW